MRATHHRFDGIISEDVNNLGLQPRWITSSSICIIDLIHDAHHLCMRLRTNEIKAMSRGFSGVQTSYKFFQYKKSQSSLFTLDKRKWTNFYIKDDNDNFIWVEVTIVTFFNAVETTDVLTASNNDVNVVETQTVHFAWLLNRRFVLRG